LFAIYTPHTVYTPGIYMYIKSVHLTVKRILTVNTALNAIRYKSVQTIRPLVVSHNKPLSDKTPQNLLLIGLKSRTMATNDPKTAKTLYEFTAKDIDGNEVSLDKYKDHPVLVVNVASNCGLTKNNYKQLNEMYGKYEGQGLRILAFPSNQFNGQEPGCDIDIKEFAKKNDVKFDMMSKIDVNGDSAHPLYKWLKNQKGGLLGFDAIKWNFTKFLIDKNGVPIKRFGPTTEPKDLEKDVKAQL